MTVKTADTPESKEDKIPMIKLGEHVYIPDTPEVNITLNLMLQGNNQTSTPVHQADPPEKKSLASMSPKFIDPAKTKKKS